MTKSVLIIGHHWPEPKSSAAGSRMMQLIQLFQDAQYHIHFACASAKNPNAEPLLHLGITEQIITINDSSFDTYISTLQPDIVLFDRFITEEQFGWRVSESCPKALCILDTEDFHGLRKGRHQALKANEEFTTAHLQNTVTKREIASIYRCDLSLIISEFEMELLRNNFRLQDEQLLYLPFLLAPISETKQQQLPSFNKRQHFITIGNCIHPPNYDAILYLKTTIWPAIRAKLPKAELHIYGAYMSDKVLQLHNAKQGFLVKGFADNVHTVMQQARLCLAPLRFGAGLKGKLVDAMQNGTPAVMTSIAAEGMFGSMSASGMMTDNPEEFANNAVTLYTDESVWDSYQKNGIAVINTRFQYQAFKEQFLTILERSLQDLEGLRERNFIGQMLQYHSLQSTKFMSKWIEAKHKN